MEGARDIEALNVAQGDVWKHFVRLAMRVEHTYRRANREGLLDQFVVVRTSAQRKNCLACVKLVTVYEAVYASPTDVCYADWARLQSHMKLFPVLYSAYFNAEKISTFLVLTETMANRERELEAQQAGL